MELNRITTENASSVQFQHILLYLNKTIQHIPYTQNEYILLNRFFVYFDQYIEEKSTINDYMPGDVILIYY